MSEQLAIRNKINKWPMVGLWSVLLTLLVPFMQTLYYYPLVEWWRNALVLALVAFALIWRLPASTGEAGKITIPKACLFAFLLALYIVLSFSLLSPQSYISRSLFPMVCLIIASLAGFIVYAEAARLGRDRVIHCLAIVLCVGAIIQALLGAMQVSGLAVLIPGDLVLFDRSNPSGNIMGNIGQRNQYAHYLAWGMTATCYLYSEGKSRSWAFHLSALLLALLMAWSGSRLVLAYMAGFVVLALLWYRRADGSTVTGQRCMKMSKALLIACVYIVMTQLFLEQLTQLFHVAGWQISGTSGAGRLMEAGFGARRRIEWAKAWQVFRTHPLFGTAWDGFAYQSVWLEAFGGYPKFSESVLFTHSHNLFAQLLAETGIVGAAIVITALSCCLFPYFRKKQVTAGNLLLISLAMVTLGHSMFEYPLWSLPFLCGLMIVLALSPNDGVQLNVRISWRRFGSGVSVILIGWYLVTGVSIFSDLAQWRVRSANPSVNEQRVSALVNLARNPLWSYDADQQLSTYLSSDRQLLATKRQLFERLVAYRPYHYQLSQLAILRALDKDSTGAREAMAMRIAAYPDSVGSILAFLQTRNEPELQPLREMAERAVKAYQQGGAEAAARTASLPEAHKALF
ncbi:PglL family O-oligosaccharyltransferase [Pseudogulbenkiania sp. NH8B]|uniref:PglL family O-oligosaccharyltransferase n=1 Tax=Pseudogulbenkiania sp. (strain NH8B) TaxID=748280 RepID=UPI0002F56543|nr:O-antigen ligase family protein [Pseudogulbenkiania sp. NH8B]